MIVFALSAGLTACGPSAEEKAKREQQIKDSTEVAHFAELAAAQADSMKRLETNRKLDPDKCFTLSWKVGEKTVPAGQIWQIDNFIIYQYAVEEFAKDGCDYSSQIAKTSHTEGNLIIEETSFCKLAVNGECKSWEDIKRNSSPIQTTDKGGMSYTTEKIILKAGDKICIPAPGKGNDKDAKFYEMPVDVYNVTQ